jgi:hypothetical protein
MGGDATETRTLGVRLCFDWLCVDSSGAIDVLMDGSATFRMVVVVMAWREYSGKSIIGRHGCTLSRPDSTPTNPWPGLLLQT